MHISIILIYVQYTVTKLFKFTSCVQLRKGSKMTVQVYKMTVQTTFSFRLLSSMWVQLLHLK